MLFSNTLAAAALLAVKASATIFYAGVAESGGEFGVYSATAQQGYGLPGVFGQDYSFIDKKGIDVYVDKNKVNLFRVAFLLERMCPLSYGLGSKFNETHFNYYADAVNYITKTKGAYCILDPHSYMRYNNPSQQPMTGSIIGDTKDVTAATTAQFGAFWKELAKRFAGNEKVIFSIMNEPHDMETNLVLANNQAAIDAIRSTGAKQLIIAPGNSWSGGHAWTQSYTGYSPSSADAMVHLKDPLNNTALDIHEYLDVDYSGGHSLCASPAPENLKDLTAWLKANKLKAMITEFGASNGTQCESYLTGMLQYMADNEEYIGWTAWAAGPFWGTYSPCCTDSQQWGSLEPGSKAGDGSPGMYETVWLKTIQKFVPKKLVWKGTSSVKGGPLSKRP
ncbi:(Trans)glycosidase [Glarea lozoyensis ATCC 20868]|uniref:cellulase n=1 Tax=Glarea lozoyensis (strain ATCC 20868 / MF5171) TaxID=1116229 RepID=S3CY69_GLAL2|nr:(Trans)glycosidase [Glarea lozoyensis ATCC 20868]EPE29894.1 (Trans)glycosidase [Glarea lozoyensis ATCC 20868]